MAHITGIDTGILEECEMWKVESRFFPSKVSGKPAWLDLEGLPTGPDLCNRQIIFLCQVFRSNLQRHNKFNPEQPLAEEPDPSFTLYTHKWVKLCNSCSLAEKQCSKCKVPYYCREHQVFDWKDCHKNECRTNNVKRAISKKLFFEYELAVEPEEFPIDQVDEKRALKECEELEKRRKTGKLLDVSEAALQAHAAVDTDKVFSLFRKKIKFSRQVLRYERGGTLLWTAKEPIPIVPACEYCGGKRQFEFQVMPQILSMLGENELDWGILVAYSCKNSCVNNASYKKEFIFKQDITSIGL